MSENVTSEADRREEIDRLILERDVREFYYEEARLLDARRLHDWLDLLAEDISYRAPVTVTAEQLERGHSDDSYYFEDDIGSLTIRAKRFDSEYAWSERPPSRTRRYVTNIRAEKPTGTDVGVESNLLVFVNQGDTDDYSFLAAEREDILQQSDEGFRIRDRTIRLDHGVLGVDKLSIFL